MSQLIKTESTPILNGRKKGKYTEDPIRNLPQLPEKRLKGSWNDSHHFNQFQLGDKDNEVGQNSFDLIKEINSKDPKKYKLLGEIRTKRPTKSSSNENSLKSAENAKRNREEFRRSLVDIIM